MTNKASIITASVVLALCAALFAVTMVFAKRNDARTLCTGVSIEIRDSASIRNVTSANVKAYLRECRDSCVGCPLYGIDLAKIEEGICSRGAVSDCQAWCTSDGILHLEVGQRQPVIALKMKGFTLYCDSRGLVFPIDGEVEKSLLNVDGFIQAKLEKGAKGMVEDPGQAEWLSRIARLGIMIGQDKYLSGKVEKISVAKDGTIRISTTDKIDLVFGTPDKMKEKFGRIDRYYKQVATTTTKRYKEVDVRFAGQIVCR